MLDLKQYEPTRVLKSLDEPLVVVNNMPPKHVVAHDGHTHETAYLSKEDNYQFRYVVHRQDVGFFTPVVFDVRLKYVELQGGTDFTTKNKLNEYVEPFVEGALFMNHTSQFIVSMLKGQEAGYNRKTTLEDIRKSIVGKNDLWYSDWQVPPPTLQSQRIVIYDMEQTGSMLDPVNVLKQIPVWVDADLKRSFEGTSSIYYAAITAGYIEKTI